LRNRLSVIRQQLQGKLNILDRMNKDILEPCDPSAIVTAIEEPDAVVVKVISYKFKVKLLAVTSSDASLTPSMTPVAPPTMPAVTLLDVTKCGILLSQLLMRTHNSTSLITCTAY